MAAFVDAERAVADWVNSLPGLVGVGKPLAKGAHLTALRGAASSCYALLTLLPSSPVFGVENPDHRARISASIYGPTKEAATTAAIAYANALLTLDGRRRAMNQAVICLVVDSDSISGPAWAPDAAGPRLVVDADFILRAA